MKKYNVSAVCGLGLRRSNNEDNMCINGVYLDETAVEATGNAVYEYSGTFSGPVRASVCDGMGGESAGERASQIAVRSLAALDPSAGENEILALLRRVNNELLDDAKSMGVIRIGCTAAILSLADDTALVLNVGDSRVYRLRRRSLKQLTRDQSYVQELIDAGVISEKKARVHPMRHNILQFLGMADDKLDLKPAEKFDIAAGDVFLLCSDGLTECIDDSRISKMIRSGASARELYDAAMQNGGVDNTTIILIRVD